MMREECPRREFNRYESRETDYEPSETKPRREETKRSEPPAAPSVPTPGPPKAKVMRVIYDYRFVWRESKKPLKAKEAWMLVFNDPYPESAAQKIIRDNEEEFWFIQGNQLRVHVVSANGDALAVVTCQTTMIDG